MRLVLFRTRVRNFYSLVPAEMHKQYNRWGNDTHRWLTNGLRNIPLLLAQYIKRCYLPAQPVFLPATLPHPHKWTSCLLAYVYCQNAQVVSESAAKFHTEPSVHSLSAGYRTNESIPQAPVVTHTNACRRIPCQAGRWKSSLVGVDTMFRQHFKVALGCSASTSVSWTHCGWCGIGHKNEASYVTDNVVISVQWKVGIKLKV